MIHPSTRILGPHRRQIPRPLGVPKHRKRSGWESEDMFHETACPKTIYYKKTFSCSIKTVGRRDGFRCSFRKREGRRKKEDISEVAKGAKGCHTHTIHVLYIYLHLPIYHKNQPFHVGKYTSPMDGMGYVSFCWGSRYWLSDCRCCLATSSWSSLGRQGRWRNGTVWGNKKGHSNEQMFLTRSSFIF